MKTLFFSLVMFLIFTMTANAQSVTLVERPTPTLYMDGKVEIGKTILANAKIEKNGEMTVYAVQSTSDEHCTFFFSQRPGYNPVFIRRICDKTENVALDLGEAGWTLQVSTVHSGTFNFEKSAANGSYWLKSQG